MRTDVDFGAIVEAIGDAVVVCDRKGLITLWNPAASRIFGFTEDEAVGASLDIIIPEKQRARHWEGYDASMATGTTRYGNDVLRVPALTKSGATISIAFTVAMLHGADGSVQSIAAVMRDDTRRFQQDKAMRDRLKELEAEVRRAGPAAAVAHAVEVAGGMPAGSGCPVKHD